MLDNSLILNMMGKVHSEDGCVHEGESNTPFMKNLFDKIVIKAV